MTEWNEQRKKEQTEQIRSPIENMFASLNEHII